MTAALKCFRCGKYTPEGAGSILPCYDYNLTDLRECRSTDKFCLKYLNKGIIVRDCVEKCESGSYEYPRVRFRENTYPLYTVCSKTDSERLRAFLHFYKNAYKTNVHELSEFFCCDEDGCNGSPIIQVEWTVWMLLFILIIIFKHEMT